MKYLLLIFVLTSCAATCNRKPGRPNSELCTWMSEAQVWECEDASGRTRSEDPIVLMCTTIDGYAALEKYVDAKEAKIRELERRLNQCR